MPPGGWPSRWWRLAFAVVALFRFDLLTFLLSPWGTLDYWFVTIQVSYAIGLADPLSITVFDYGTSKYSQSQLLAIVKKNFDLRPGAITKSLNLKSPIYQKTAAYGHFGRDIFTWEQPKDLIL